MKKDEILSALEEEREAFRELLDELDDKEMEAPGVVGDWSVKDLLAHLVSWEAELIKLLWQTEQGAKPTTVHFRRASVDETNARWYAENKDRPLERVLKDWEAVRKQTIRRVVQFSEQDLNDPQRFPWQEGSPLWEWIENDSFGHEAEHAEQLEAWIDRRQAPDPNVT